MTGLTPGEPLALELSSTGSSVHRARLTRPPAAKQCRAKVGPLHQARGVRGWQREVNRLLVVEDRFKVTTVDRLATRRAANKLLRFA